MAKREAWQEDLHADASPAKTWIHMEEPLMNAAAVAPGIVSPRAIPDIAWALALALVFA